MTNKQTTRVWHPYTKFSAFEAGPLPDIVRGEGVYLFDSAGHRYLDAVSSWWSCSLGHGQPDIVAAIQRQAAELQHSILGNLSHPRATELAARIATLMPTPERHVLFASDGASAVEAALKIALQYWHNRGHPERKRFAYLEDAYHGDTLGAVSVGYLEGFHKPFEPILFPAFELPVPPNAAAEHAALEQIRTIFDAHGQELAALIIEPLCQGAAGMKMYSVAHLRRLAELCRERDILLIVDEIATGFGRTGRMFAFEHADIDPDIVCLGKSLSAGYLPISATVVEDAIFNTFSDKPVDHSFYHGHTFCGNPIAAAAALAALDIYERIDIAGCARRIERVFRKMIEPLAKLPQVKDVRMLGAIATVELAGESQPNAAAMEEGLPAAQAIRQRMLEAGILIRPLGNVVYLMPPLTIPDDILTTLCQTLVTAVATSQSLSSAPKVGRTPRPHAQH